MMEKLTIYFNGKLVPFDEAKVSAFDRGILYGYGLFETLRAYGGRVFRLERHLERLRRSARAMGLEQALAPFDLAQGVYQTLEANALSDARIRITVSAGVGERAIALPTQGDITVTVLSEKFPQISPSLYRDGASLATVPFRRDSFSSLPLIKSTSMLVNMLAYNEARARGADEALLLNARGFVAEGSSSNVFLVKDGRFLTPSVESGILDGITREAVLELARMLEIPVVEGEIPVQDLMAAEEAFITSSIRDVMPVVRVDGSPIGSGKPGPVTRRLMDAFGELVRKETGRSP